MPSKSSVAIVTLFLALIVLSGCSSDSNSGDSLTPVRLAMTEDAVLLASDYQSQSVKLIDSSTLSPVGSIAVNGAPLAIGYAEGKVFVGNETRQCVEVYNLADGEKLYDLGDGPGSIPIPNDLAIDTQERLVFVADSSNQRVAFFSIDGAFINEITNLHNLPYPVGIAVDEALQQVYVSNSYRNFSYSILPIFSYAGDLIGDVSTPVFSHPQGVALDNNGHLFIADVLLGQVQVVDLASSSEVYRFGNPLTYTGQRQMPLDVVFSPDLQEVFVADFLAERIDRFAMTEIAP